MMYHTKAMLQEMVSDHLSREMYMSGLRSEPVCTQEMLKPTKIILDVEDHQKLHLHSYLT